MAFTEHELKNGLSGCLRACTNIGRTGDTNIAYHIVPEVYLVIDKEKRDMYHLPTTEDANSEC